MERLIALPEERLNMRRAMALLGWVPEDFDTEEFRSCIGDESSCCTDKILDALCVYYDMWLYFVSNGFTDKKENKKDGINSYSYQKDIPYEILSIKALTAYRSIYEMTKQLDTKDDRSPFIKRLFNTSDIISSGMSKEAEAMISIWKMCERKS